MIQKKPEDINEGVKSIRKTLKRGLSSRECTGNTKLFEAFVILSVSWCSFHNEFLYFANLLLVYWIRYVKSL